MSRLSKIKEFIKDEHLDVFANTKRIVDMIDHLEYEHRVLVASQALAGIRPNGEEDILFYNTLQQVRNNSIEILEKEVEDWQHKGDKHYTNNFDKVEDME